MRLRSLLLLCGLISSGAHAAPERAANPPAKKIVTGRPVLITAPLTARWLGGSGLAITDGEATLLFDPVATKPGLQHWLFGLKFRSDVPRVRAALAKAQIQSAEAIFISHTYFDSAVDMAVFSQLTGATVYGGHSLGRIASHNDFPVRFSRSDDRRVVQIGKFKVTMIRRTHPAVFRRLGYKFLPGPVPEDFNFGFYQFREGEVWCYFIEHPSGNILIDSESEFFEGNLAYAGRVHTYFVGVANKQHLENLVLGNIHRIAPRRVVPLHFDFQWLKSEWFDHFRILGSTIEELRARLREEPDPAPALLVPTVAQPIPIP